MNTSYALLPWACVLAIGACGPTGSQADDAGSPNLQTEVMASLRALSPDVLPAPPEDRSNRFADDPAAAALGQRFFFEPRFSGELLDDDNTGGPQSLGVAGESGRVACAGCHIPGAGFQDNRSARRQISLASGWGRRKTKSLLDVGQAKIIMWDGRHDALYNQPLQPFEGVFEMNSSRLFVAQQVYRIHRSTYESVFGPIPIPLDDAVRFPQLDGSTTGCRLISSATNTGNNCHGMPGDGAEFDSLSPSDRDEVTRVVVNVGKALGAYERLLTCGTSRFDQWMQGDSAALDASERRGAALFVGYRADGTTVASCSACHAGPFLTDQAFHNVGMQPAAVGPAGGFKDEDDHGAGQGLASALEDPLNVRGKFSDGDDGRLPESVPAWAEGAFRTPSLRCVAQRPAFMHTGQLATLEDVVRFFDEGGHKSGFFGVSENTPRNYTATERADLVLFLRALDGAGPDAALLEAPSD
ncbi:MAG TPA: cytochrome c peroxidase [Polyangiaceae bacterium]|nr:cytochrome c peroxidase [Polyangiaceae bacterium]